MAVGCIIGLTMVLASAYAKNYWLFYILYSGGFAIATGVSVRELWLNICCQYIVPVKTSWLYFKNNKGLVSGIVVCGFGFGSFIFGLISTKIVNPNNIPSSNGTFPKEVYDNVPKMIKTLVLCWTVLVCISILMFFPY